MARDLSIARSGLYYVGTPAAFDEEKKRQIEAVMVEHMASGHTRIGLLLKMGHTRMR